MQGNSVTYIQLTPEQLQKAIQEAGKETRARDMALAIRMSEAISGCFSVDECAAHFKVTRQTIFNWIRQGKIKVLVEGQTPYAIPKIQFYKDIIESVKNELEHDEVFNRK